MSINIPSLRWHAFHEHKRGNAANEYEDAYAGDAAAARFAVADGASESSFVAAWAKLLTEGFITAEGKPWRDLDWLLPARARWAAEIDPLPLPWYAEEKREQGAYATFLGIVLGKAPASGGRQPPVTFRWRAVAVGDSCLFRLRKGRLLQSFPLSRSSDFGNQPPLLGSRGRAADTPANVPRLCGKVRCGERLLLMTDALAEWMLRRTEQEQRPADDIDRLLAEADPHHAFAAWVQERRERQGLRNDDVTLMVIDPIG
jgi:hypothetical protein